LTVACDVSQTEQVKQAARQIVNEMGRVDILVNNAGIPAPRTFQDTDFADWDQVIGVNLSGVFYMTRALWEALTASGAGYVINIAGTAGLRGGSSPAYGSAKFGLTGLTRAIAASGQAHDLRATVLYPGAMDTGWRGAPIGEKPRAETMDPQEVARFVGYLVSTPPEFVVNEAVLNPSADTWL
jgi:NAD(P)-dependent dehydrogenase (short-subunit alcohol dehydrogenase family)